jgi:hypothetical protein
MQVGGMMKRSEIVKVITDILFYGRLSEAARLGARKDFITNLAEEDAEAVLKELEKFGMLPPSTYIKTFDKYDNIWDTEEDEN